MRFALLLLMTLILAAGCQEKPKQQSKPSAPKVPATTSKENSESAPAKESTQVEQLAARLLNDDVDEQERRDLYPEYPQLAAEIVAEMAKGYPFGEEEEYRRIPWIWRVSINATKTLNKEEIRELLEVGLPKVGEPLTEWQAVVIGGGVINGLTLKGEWPREFLKPIIERDTGLIERWNHMLEESLVMVHNKKIKTGTRYDALRNIAMLSWEEAGAHLTEYLTYGADPEMKQGAICGMADMHSAAVDSLLLAGWLHYEPHNRFFALEGMLRTPDRFRILNKEVRAGRVDTGFLSDEDRQKLLEHPHALTRQHAAELLAGSSTATVETIEVVPEAVEVHEAVEPEPESPSEHEAVSDDHGDGGDGTAKPIADTAETPEAAEEKPAEQASDDHGDDSAEQK
ncbi:MAG: hypothetical protein CMJ46_09495 [Planctomyces sp.]|nr:hypothetical protein [Planctomyces sp.]